jgi:branched-chain amino acid transport system ATP-binding protein
VLRVEGLAVAINAVNILRGLNLAVERDSIVALVGRNGAGKTTTMRSIMGLTRPSAGRIDLAGTQIEAISAYLRARLGIGYLPEDRRLVGTLSVRDNLLIPAQIGGASHYEERLKEIFGLMPELQEWSTRKCVALSGGQQKMVALARAFVNGRKLLLLDEPFEGISTALSRRLAHIVQDFRRSQPGLAVLVAESDVKRAAMLTSRAFVIERGEVIEEASLG